MIGKLFIVGTPIGNMEDITLRAIKTLRSVDRIAAENTHTAQKLLARYHIKKPLMAHHSHNQTESAKGIIKLLMAGENIAYISEAGMPGVSDPGAKLVRECRKAGVEIDAIPGPCAITDAAALSGVIRRTFTFIGFPPATGKMRRRELRALSATPHPIMCYESPHRLIALLKDIMEIMGDRQLVLARELTKIHQEIWEGSVSELALRTEKQPFKGEITLIILPEEE